MREEMFGTVLCPVKEVVCETIEEFNEQIIKISEQYSVINVDSVDPGTAKFDDISKVVIYTTSKTPKWIMLCTAGDSTLFRLSPLTLHPLVHSHYSSMIIG